MATIRRDDHDRFFDYDIHVPSRTLFVGGEVDAELAERLIKGLHLLTAAAKEGPVRILLNSPGGDVYDGLAAYDAIATCPAHVTVVAFGHAMSMGSWIIQAADERVLAPSCTMMIHHGSGGIHDRYKYVQAEAAEHARIARLMEQTYLRRIKERDPTFSARRLKTMLDTDTYLTAVEAVELGLADRVLGD